MLVLRMLVILLLMLLLMPLRFRILHLVLCFPYLLVFCRAARLPAAQRQHGIQPARHLPLRPHGRHAQEPVHRHVPAQAGRGALHLVQVLLVCLLPACAAAAATAASATTRASWRVPLREARR